MRRTLTLFLCVSLTASVFSIAALGETSVNSQEQFQRLMPDGLPDNVRYNFDRAFLELAPDDQHCPAASRAFFSLRINQRGEVTRANGRILSLSAKLTSVGLKWAEGVLKQMRFSPLKYGDRAASVDMPVTVVCQSQQTVPSSE